MTVFATITLRHPVIILSRGHGSRLAAVARGRHKTTEKVGGRPILAWILHELRGLNAPSLVLHLREHDPEAARITATHPQPVLIDTGRPRGYLLDVHACAGYGERFTVLEADTVCYPGSLRNFLILAETLGDHHDLCVGVAPVAANRNGPALVVDRAGLVTAMSWQAAATGLVPLAAWHWSARLLTHAPAFAADTGSTSTADYVTWAVQRGAAVAGIGIPAGFNINTPADLAAAQTGAAGWLDPTEPLTDRSLAS
jgi:molybdopterin-guanine dinucleotide biosynthesis protein A